MDAVLPSQFRVETQRTSAVIALANGLAVVGNFFLAEASPTLPGPQRVVELLNSEPGFFPFEEDEGGGTALYNRDHIVTIEIFSDEARRDPGYGIAATRTVVIRLSDGRTLRGAVRVYRPEGRDRLSDWARHGQRFRYVEGATATFIVNIDHIIDIREAT